MHKSISIDGELCISKTKKLKGQEHDIELKFETCIQARFALDYLELLGRFESQKKALMSCMSADTRCKTLGVADQYMGIHSES